MREPSPVHALEATVMPSPIGFETR